MTSLSFSAQVQAWIDKVPEAVEAVFKESTQDVVSVMQTPTSSGGRMRVVSGFLRASLMASTSSMPNIDPAARPVEGQTYSYDFGQIEAVIASAKLGQTIFAGYTAAYAGFREYGARGQPPDAFVRTAVQGWQDIVNRNAEKTRKAFGL